MDSGWWLVNRKAAAINRNPLRMEIGGLGRQDSSSWKSVAGWTNHYPLITSD
jgi:hypothetical protein